MSSSDAQILIIGAGPAGISAALEAVNNKVQVTVLDEGKKIGGQIFRQVPDGFGINENKLDSKLLDKHYFSGKKLISQLDNSRNGVKVIQDATAWGILPGNEVLYTKDGKTHSIKYKKLILAEGAYEVPAISRLDVAGRIFNWRRPISSDYLSSRPGKQGFVVRYRTHSIGDGKQFNKGGSRSRSRFGGCIDFGFCK